MPFQYQVSDARADNGIRAASGVCGDVGAFTQQVNAATRQLMKRGCWLGMEVPMQFCIEGPCVTLPRHVGAVVAIRACGHRVPVKNNWYAIVGPSCNSGAEAVAEEAGRAPTYNDVSAGGRRIAYHVVKRPDVGKKITIFGFDSNGQPLQERDEEGNWRNGVSITAVAAGGDTNLPAMTSVKVGRITNIVREPTQGMSYLYEYDDSTSQMRDLAAYEPSETNPMYRRMRIRNLSAVPSWTDEYGRTMRAVTCMVRLQYVPVSGDSDFLLIDDFDALRYAIQALRKDEAGEADAAEVFWTKAIRELNMGERAAMPQSAISVRVRALGRANICNPI
jgi:hypothetical protein